MYLLFLDARSAFDVVVPELLLRQMYLSGMDGNTVNYMNHRLCNRRTYIDWDREIVGPIMDEHGLEQGGGSSGDFYKLYNNDLLKSTQMSEQGVMLGDGQVYCLLDWLMTQRCPPTSCPASGTSSTWP